MIRSGDPGDSRLQHRKLAEFRWRLVASSDYLERAGAPERVRDLAGHRCLRHRNPETGKIAPWPLVDDGDGPGEVPVSLAATLVDSLFLLARAGRGIASLPDFMVRDGLADGSLVEVPPGLLQEGGVFRPLWPASRHPLPKARALVDLLSDGMGARLAGTRGDTAAAQLP